MPPSLTLKPDPKPDPATLYTCLTGYIGDEGIFPTGYRLSGSHPAVIKQPKFWAPANLDELQLAELRIKRFPTD